MKQAMDIYFTISQKEEREFQQLVIRENNSSAIANGTDYFIIDIEYVIAHARFDIVAVEWESNTSKRKLQKRYLPKLVLIEMKVGDKSLKNKAGLQKHLFDFNNFLNNPNLVSKFKSEMIELFRQKRKLGLIPALTGNSNDVYQFDDTIELMFLIANHDPESNVLRNEVKLFANSNTSFMTANFMGYAMYKDSKMSLTDLLSRF